MGAVHGRGQDERVGGGDGVLIPIMLVVSGVALAVMLVDMLRWPCGRCSKRLPPWKRSCSSCLERLAERFDRYG